MTKKKPGAKRGRPKRALDYALIERLAQRQGSIREIAACVGIDEAALRRRMEKEPDLSAAVKRGEETGKMTLRTRQYNAAMDGNPALLIWLGKQYLGQRDQQDTKITGEISHTGAYDLSNLSTEQLEQFQALMRQAAAKKAAEEGEAA